jgi:adenosylmethionine-8-amino-7-oxononanoate aminotransferase
MTDTSNPRTTELVDLARRHLWTHMSPQDRDTMTVIERGEGCWIWDVEGNRYFDGLSGLFTVNVGHGRSEIAAAAAAQSGDLAYFPIWGNAHPRAIELAARLAQLAPANLNRVFFTSGGSEAVDSAWKLARNYFKAIGQPQRTKIVSRHFAYHGTTFGALSITGIPEIRAPFEPLVPGARHAQPAYPYRCAFCAGRCNLQCADDIERVVLTEGPDTIAAIILEPVQNTGGSLVPPPDYFTRVREICDEHGILLISDEVICAFGRIGAWFGAQRYGYEADMLTFAKGVTSGYAPLGGVLVSDRVAEPFLGGDHTFFHGITFGGHPVSCAVALANLDIMAREDLPGRVLAHEQQFEAALRGLLDIPIVGDVRGTGYFWSIELVRDQATKTRLSEDECVGVLKGFLGPRLLELGLICRADDRAEPVLVIAPPLVAGPDDFEYIAARLRAGLLEAAERIG